MPIIEGQYSNCCSYESSIATAREGFPKKSNGILIVGHFKCISRPFVIKMVDGKIPILPPLPFFFWKPSLEDQTQ